jgi:hypothetical protein
MTKVLRLIEDWPHVGTIEALPSGTPRTFYVAAGTVTINGKEIVTDEGYVSTDELILKVGESGAAMWRWEVVNAASSTNFIGNRGIVILEGPIDGDLLQNGALIRLDSVAFPPKGIAIAYSSRTRHSSIE